MLIPFFRPDRIPSASVVARVNGEATEAVAQAAVQVARGMNTQALKDATISNLVSAGMFAGFSTLSHAFIPVKEHS